MARTFLVSLFLGFALLAQQVLTNEAVTKMVKAGLGEEVILSMINTQPVDFQLNADQLIALKQAGVSDKVIAAMVQRAAGAGPATPTPAAQTEPPAAMQMVPEVGVYYQKDGKWVEIPPEVVNWKTGGVLKSVATVGIVKGDVNGRITGPTSPTKLTTPVEILIYTPEATAITEYQFLDLREKKKAREFRTVTGGVFHASGGSTRDLESFKAEKLAPRHYKVMITNLAAGEYGFLPPGMLGAQSASAQLGKMYTFSLIE